MGKACGQFTVKDDKAAVGQRVSRKVNLDIQTPSTPPSSVVPGMLSFIDI